MMVDDDIFASVPISKLKNENYTKRQNIPNKQWKFRLFIIVIFLVGTPCM